MEPRKKKRSIIADIWHRFKKNKTAVGGLLMLCILLFFAIFADFISDYDTRAIHHNSQNRLQQPSMDNFFGTDEFGRDIFTRVIFGMRNSLSMALSATAASLLIAIVVGSIAAFYGGLLDSFIMRILDMFMGLPMILLAIAISASLGPGGGNLVLAMTISQVPSFTRITRSAILNIVGQEYIEAAKSYGSNDAEIIYQHILPNAIGVIIVQATMAVSTTILSIAALSYLGLGIAPPAPELGSMLSDGREFMRHSPNMVIFPGLTIALIALSLNLFGDGLRDALDPRLKN